MEESPRRSALRAYLLEVTRDLLMRGIIKRQQGQTIVQVMRTEGAAVLDSVKEDLSAAGRELGVKLVAGLVEQILGGLVGGGIVRGRR